MVTVNCYEPSTVQWFALNFRSVYKTAYGKHWHSRNTGRIFTRSQVNLFELCLYKSIFMPYVVTFLQKNTYLHVWDFLYSINLFSIFFLVKHLALLVIDINVNINPLGRTSFWLCVTGIHRVRSIHRGERPTNLASVIRRSGQEVKTNISIYKLVNLYIGSLF